MRSAGGVVILIAVLTVFIVTLALGPIAQHLQDARTAPGVTAPLSGAFEAGTLVIGFLGLIIAALLVAGLARR